MCDGFWIFSRNVLCKHRVIPVWVVFWLLMVMSTLTSSKAIWTFSFELFMWQYVLCQDVIDVLWYLYLFVLMTNIEKFSRHLVIHIPGAAFKDNTHAGAFVSEVWSEPDFKCLKFSLKSSNVQVIRYLWKYNDFKAGWVILDCNAALIVDLYECIS